jgi:hypothetical protein
MLLAKLRQNGQGQTAAPQLQPKILKNAFCNSHAVLHTLYINYCISYSVCRQVYLEDFSRVFERTIFGGSSVSANH